LGNHHQKLISENFHLLQKKPLSPLTVTSHTSSPQFLKTTNIYSACMGLPTLGI
jgi:hypothetical protein